MAWSTPKTWVAGATLTASDMNTYLSDNDAALRAGGLALGSQAAGDVLYASSATQLARVAIGTAGQLLRVNSGATAPEWATHVSSGAAYCVQSKPAAGQTLYCSPSHGGANAGGTGTEANVAVPVPVAGTLKNLRLKCSNAPGAGQSYAITVRKNGSDTSVAATISDTATTASDTSNSAAFSAGDLLTVKVVASGSATDLSSGASGGVQISFEYEV